MYAEAMVMGNAHKGQFRWKRLGTEEKQRLRIFNSDLQSPTIFVMSLVFEPFDISPFLTTVSLRISVPRTAIDKIVQDILTAENNLL